MRMKKFFASALAVIIIVLAAVPGVSALTPTTKVSDVYKAGTYYQKLTAVELTGNQRVDIFNVAMSQLGYHEGNSNSEFNGTNTSGTGNFTEYNYTYGTIGDPATYGYEWCASFSTWCLKQAGVPLAKFIGEISCSRWVTKLTAAGIYKSVSTGYTPSMGDIIFFKNASSTSSSTHVGLVRYVSGTTVNTIEGNSDNQVRLRSYSLSDTYIVGYGTPAYTDTSGGSLGNYSVTASALNIRAGIGTSFSALTSMPNGTVVEVKAKSSGWGLVTYNGYTGWASMTYLKSEAASYTVSYNANGGTGAPESQTKTGGEALTLSSAVPSRTGYNFLGWALTSSASSAQYQPGGIYSPDSSATLYAVWAKKTYTISYNANGGTGAPESQTKTYAVPIYLSEAEPTKAGSAFYGWAVTPTAASAQYVAGGQFLPNTSVTLYAVWGPFIYEVSYDANGGTGAPDSQTKIHDTALTLSAAIPVKDGCSFLGWSSDINAVSAEYGRGASYTENAPLVLYAVWEADVYTVRYEANGGAGGPDSQTKTHGESLTLSGELPMRNGYVFAGWSYSSTATEAVYTAGDTYEQDSSAILYAVWEPDSTWIPMKIAASSEASLAGETVTVTFTVSDNPGMWCAVFDVVYDHSVLTLDSVANGTVFSDSEFFETLLSADTYRFYSESDNLANNTNNGTLFTMTFTIADAAAAGDYPISFIVADENILDVSETSVPYETVQGNVNVMSGERGDVNDDGKINSTDILMLRLTVAGTNTLSARQTILADCNDDSKINSTDILMLRLKVAGAL